MSLLSSLRIKTNQGCLYARVDQSPRSFQNAEFFVCRDPAGIVLPQWPSCAANAILSFLSESLSGFASEIAGAFSPSVCTTSSVFSLPAVLKPYCIECCTSAVCRREDHSSQIARPLWRVCRFAPIHGVSLLTTMRSRRSVSLQVVRPSKTLFCCRTKQICVT